MRRQAVGCEGSLIQFDSVAASTLDTLQSIVNASAADADSAASAQAAFDLITQARGEQHDGLVNHELSFLFDDCIELLGQATGNVTNIAGNADLVQQALGQIAKLNETNEIGDSTCFVGAS
jgi:hypothetical protein